MNRRKFTAYTRTTPVEAVLNDPIFGDYGRLIFPVERFYYSGDTLEQLHLTPAEIEVFPGLAHGFGLGTGTSAEDWLDHAVAF